MQFPHVAYLAGGAQDNRHLHCGGIDDEPVASWIEKVLWTGGSHGHFF
jgi:hypothetical protein